MLGIYGIALVLLTFGVFLVVSRFKPGQGRCFNVIPGREQFCPYCGESHGWPWWANHALTIGISLAIALVMTVIVTLVLTPDSGSDLRRFQIAIRSA